LAYPSRPNKAIDALKKAGKKSALMLVANGTGDVRFVALAIE
jgi:serine protease Do